MKEDYVSFEIAKLLKEKEFHELCHRAYHYYGYALSYHHKEKDFNGEEYSKLNTEWYSAPTQQMAMRWLREQHNLHIDIDISDGDWNPCVIELENWSVVSEYDTEKTQDTYEDAVEYALKYCLTKLI